MQHSVNCHFFLKYLCRNLLKILVVSEPISIRNFFIDEVSFELFKVTVSNHKCTLTMSGMTLESKKNARL